MNLFIIPSILSILIFGIEYLSKSVALWFSLAFHGGLSVYLIYVVIFSRKKGDDPIILKRKRERSKDRDK